MTGLDALSDAQLVERFALDLHPGARPEDGARGRFAALAIAPADFRHREHIRLAFALLARHASFAEAAVEFRRLLRAFAAHHGVAERYHETVTMAYLAIVNERMDGAGHADSLAFVAAHPDLLDHKTGALAHYYDVGAITASSVARRVFVLPGQRP